MALPSSGALSIQDIVGEFGGVAEHNMAEYYRNGGLVPNTQTVVGGLESPAYVYKGYSWIDDGSTAKAYYNGFAPSPARATTTSGATSVTSGNEQYFRSSFQETVNGNEQCYRVQRIVTTTSFINQSVPETGEISIFDFYGAFDV